MSLSHMFFILGSLATLTAPSSAAGFLKTMDVSTREVESNLLMELSGNVKVEGERIRTFEKALEPLFNSVPKEVSGTLSHTVVRYVLHRFFAQNRGWYIRGLEPAGDARNASLSALKAMQEWVPSYLQSFLEHLVGGRGLSLKELAVFAATLEDLILKEEATWLKSAYKGHGFSTSTPLTEKLMMDILETYMMLYVIKGNFTAEDPRQVHKLHELFNLKVKNWKDTKQWIHDVLKELFSGPHLYSFEDSTRIVKLAGERYGTFNDRECARLKAALLSIESKKPGRVRLADFYKQALNGTWDFNEKIDYLRVLGAIDESDPSTPLVIMPNYVASRPNCLTTSSFYAVCCRNECEDLMQVLEGNLRRAEADPEEIMQLVKVLPSDTVPAPRNLSSVLVQRLQNIAKLNHGQVPLHGRLFAQWMHHAFPRECPFPHAAGATSPLTADAWMESAGETNSKASDEEMLKHVNSDTCHFLPHGMACGSRDPRRSLPTNSTAVDEKSHADDEDLPWNDAEELLVTRASLPTIVSAQSLEHPPPPGYRLVLFAVWVPLAFGVAWYLKAPRKPCDEKAARREMV